MQLRLIIASALLLLILSSCKKNFTPAENNNTDIVTEFKNIKTNPQFNWRTHKGIIFEYQATPTIVPVKSTLSLRTLNGNVIFSELHLMDENKSVGLEIPNDQQIFVAGFGSNSDTLTLTNNRIIFTLSKPFISED